MDEYQRVWGHPGLHVVDGAAVRRVGDLTYAAVAAADPRAAREAAAIRALTLDAVHAANSGHSGMPMAGCG